MKIQKILKKLFILMNSRKIFNLKFIIFKQFLMFKTLKHF